MISDIKTDVWEGYECKSFTFQGKNAILVIPKEPREDKNGFSKPSILVIIRNLNLKCSLVATI